MIARVLALAFVALVLCAVGLEAVLAQKDKDTKKDDADVTTKIKKLLKERVDTLSDATKMAIAQYEAGALDIRLLAEIQVQAVRANLDLQNPEERLTALRQLQTSVEKTHQISQAKYKAGLTPALEVAYSKAIVLEVQIALLREEVKAKAQK
jgi:hypothetical protein